MKLSLYAVKIGISLLWVVSNAMQGQTMIVEANVTPETGPGPFQLGFRLTNTTGATIIVDIWETLQHPFGETKLIMLKSGNPIPGGQRLSRATDFDLKEDAATGEYLASISVGTYPDDIFGSDTVLFFLEQFETKVIASDGRSDDNFGWAVSVFDDHAVIGAVVGEGNGTNSGCAYVLHRADNVWIEEAKLVASDGRSLDLFGHAVSISGDYAAIGAKGYDGEGAVHVFHRVGSSWVEEAKLISSDSTTPDRFGWSVSISGEYVVVGAYWSDMLSGSAYVFHREGDSWIEEAKLTASDGATFDNFGWAVSISGEYAAVGAYGDDDNGASSGSTYIFHRVGSTWVEEAKLIASDGGGGDFFGSAISISDDYVVVGAYDEDEKGRNAGSAYVFHREGDEWIEDVKLTASDGVAFDSFGYSVSISGDYVVVGAQQDDDSGEASGSAYVFHREDSSWIEVAKLTPRDGSSNDFFGQSVSVSGSHAVVGAYGDDDNGAESGSSYIYSGLTGLATDAITPHDKTQGTQYQDWLADGGAEPNSNSFALLQNHPNPFNPSTTFRYGLSEPGQVSLRVYNMLGQLVRTIVDEQQVEGYHEVVWDGRNEVGATVASGIYIYRMTSGSFVETRRMLLIK